MVHLVVYGLGIVVNTESFGHITSLDSPQNGQPASNDSSFALLGEPKNLERLSTFLAGNDLGSRVDPRSGA